MLDLPNRDRQAERREATRRDIIDAAWTIARAEGLAAITLRDVGRLVGMRAPSLYSHVSSKADIYDAMFGEAWCECRDAMAAAAERAPEEPRERMKFLNRAFFDFCVADPARHQLMNTRAIPGFEPSPEAYQPSVEVLEGARERLRLLGITDDADVDLIHAIIGGLIEAQVANDPGGDRWSRLLDRATDMFADKVGLPGTTSRREA
jgi:AcrR family transcriptional regulator